MSTASIMLLANLTLGLYIHFGPRPLTPNSTLGLEIMTLGGTEQPPATSFNYLTLIPLLATMLFIMGRNTLAVGTPGMGCLGGGTGIYCCPGLPEGLGSWRIRLPYNPRDTGKTA